MCNEWGVIILTIQVNICKSIDVGMLFDKICNFLIISVL